MQNVVNALRASVMLVVAASAALVVAQPASASEPAPQSCPQDYVCFWPEPNYGGQVQVWYDPEARTCDWTAGEIAARSIWNNDDDTWSFYSDTNCSTAVATLARGQGDADVSPAALTWK